MADRTCLVARLPYSTSVNRFRCFCDNQVQYLLNYSLTTQGRSAIFHDRAWLELRVSRILFAAYLDGITHEQTTICRRLFADYVVGSRPMEKEEKMSRMVIIIDSSK